MAQEKQEVRDELQGRLTSIQSLLRDDHCTMFSAQSILQEKMADLYRWWYEKDPRRP